jgi:hypothetical protein
MALREVLASFGIDIDDKALQAAAAKIQQYEQALQNLSKDEKAQLQAFKQASDEAKKKGDADKKAAQEAQERAKAQAALVSQLRAEFIVQAAKQVVSAFTGMIKSSLDLAGSLGDTADKLGVSTTELQQFQFAGRLAGVSAEGMSQSLGFLNKGLGEAAAGTGPAKDAFTKLHLSIKDGNGQLKSAAELLPEIADKVNGLKSQGEKTATVMAIFGRSGAELLPLFKDGSKGIDEALAKFKELGLEIDKNFITQAHEVGDEVETMHVQFDVLKTKLVGAAIPALKTLSEFVLKLGAGLGNLLSHTNAAIIIFATFAGGALVAAIAGFRSLATAVGVTESELLIIIAIFAAVALVVEDIYTLFTGGDSVLGRLIDKLFGVGASKKFVEEVKKEAAALWEQFKAILPDLEELGRQLMEAFRAAAPFIAGFVKGELGAFVTWLKYAVTGIEIAIKVLGFLAQAGSAAFGVARDEVKTAAVAIEGFINLLEKAFNMVSKVANAAGGVSGLLTGGGVVMAAANSVAGGAAGNKNVNQTNQTTINVNGADQPQSTAAKIANAVADTAESKLRNAYNAVSNFL